MPLYDTAHWKELGRTYVEDFPYTNPAYQHQVDAIKGVLKENTRPPIDSIIEIGCGFGRITNILRWLFPDAKIVATDASEEMLRAAETYLANSTNEPPAKGGVGLTSFDLDTDPASHRGVADMVVAAEVLMHRRPEQAAADVEKLVAMADRYILTVDWYEPAKLDTEGNYQHPYAELVAGAGAAQGRIFNGMMRSVPEARQAVWLFEADRSLIRRSAERETIATTDTASLEDVLGTPATPAV